MKKLICFAAMALLSLLLVSGCSDNTPVESPATGNSPAQFAGIPYGATINSAMLYVYNTTLDTHLVELHLVTAPWSEGSVTWNSFGAAYDSSVLATSQFTDIGYFGFDLSAIASNFADGNADYGFLLKLDSSETSPEFISGRESGSNAAYMEICFSTPDTSGCMTFDVAADAPIYEGTPDMNYGSMPLMSLGPVNGSGSFDILLSFEVPVIQEATMSIGDWVWLDENMDGIQDSSEVGLGGVTVNLYACTDDTLADPLFLSTVTDSTGHYLFDSLAFGSYSVEFVRPDGYFFSRQHQADDSIDSDPTPTTGIVDCFEPLSPMAVLSIDAGLYPTLPHDTAVGCTSGKGFWKNHTGLGPQEDLVTPLLPLYLGAAEVGDAQTAYDYLSQKVYGSCSNGITKLYAHMLATELNIANGADPTDIADVLNAADDFLNTHDWKDWDSLGTTMRQDISEWKKMFEMYNEGEIGPGSCTSTCGDDDGHEGDHDGDHQGDDGDDLEGHDD